MSPNVTKLYHDPVRDRSYLTIKWAFRKHPKLFFGNSRDFCALVTPLSYSVKDRSFAQHYLNIDVKYILWDDPHQPIRQEDLAKLGKIEQ